MDTTPAEKPQKPRRRNGAVYTCVDDISICCNSEASEIDEETDKRSAVTAPRNGILLRPGKSPIAVVNGMRTNRDMKKIIRGGPGRTCALPSSTVIVGEYAFQENELVFVRLNEGLRALNERCFYYSGIKRLTLSSSVELVDCYSFSGCEGLRYVDLSAAHGLKSIDNYAFWQCRALK